MAQKSGFSSTQISDPSCPEQVQVFCTSLSAGDDDTLDVVTECLALIRAYETRNKPMGNNFNNMTSSWHFPEEAKPNAPTEAAGMTLDDHKAYARNVARLQRKPFYVVLWRDAYHVVSHESYPNMTMPVPQIIASYDADGTSV